TTGGGGDADVVDNPVVRRARGLGHVVDVADADERAVADGGLRRGDTVDVADDRTAADVVDGAVALRRDLGERVREDRPGPLAGVDQVARVLLDPGGP